MHKKKRKMKIKQKQKRKSKDVSFQKLSVGEAKAVAEQESRAKLFRTRLEWFGAIGRNIAAIQHCIHGIKFKPIIKELRERFPGTTLEVLDEGAGRSSLKNSLLWRFKDLNVTTTDICEGKLWPMPKKPDKIANVLDLVKSFGKNKFHLVISTGGGAWRSPVPEKAFFQIVSVLQPKGTGIIATAIPKERLYQLAKRFNVTIQRIRTLESRQGDVVNSVIFTKNSGRKKK